MKRKIFLIVLLGFTLVTTPALASKSIKYSNQKAGQFCKNLEVGGIVKLTSGQNLICARPSANAKPKWAKIVEKSTPSSKPSLTLPTPSESPTPIASPTPTPTPVNNAPVFSDIHFQSSTIKAGESAQIFFTITSSIGFSNQTGIVTLMHSSGANFGKILGVFPGGCVATSQTTLTCEGDVQISKTAPAGKYSLNIIGFADNNNVSTTVNQQEVLTVTS